MAYPRRLGSLALLASTVVTAYSAAQQTPTKSLAPRRDGYSQVGAVRMYYQVYGRGRPLPLLHGGGVGLPRFRGHAVRQLCFAAVRTRRGSRIRASSAAAVGCTRLRGTQRARGAPRLGSASRSRRPARS
jgi:hypothetical protein